MDDYSRPAAHSPRASLVPDAGAFQIGSAEPGAQTTNAPVWVAPSAVMGPVKLCWGRK